MLRVKNWLEKDQRQRMEGTHLLVFIPIMSRALEKQQNKSKLEGTWFSSFSSFPILLAFEVTGNSEINLGHGEEKNVKQKTHTQ
ncbi:hypothetical protein CEXT_187681 [Caerostris extrusa]|uniref:Ycf15 n=1 Tax=Caerostris extrusa TaxID=172846 RepID=A0AAV4TT66_CAEEX|nr:hypothetical protein CEXT_187681 [Caerostris extrusa]